VVPVFNFPLCQVLNLVYRISFLLLTQGLTEGRRSPTGVSPCDRLGHLCSRLWDSCHQGSLRTCCFSSNAPFSFTTCPAH